MPDDMMALAEGEALTADEVAAMLQVSKNTVYNLVKRDELASYHVGRKMRFTRADVQNYVARSRRQKAWGQHGAPANPSVQGLGQTGEAAALAAAASAATAAHPATAPAPSSRPATAAHATAAPTAPPRPASAYAEAVGSYVIAGNDIVGDMLANYLGMVDVPIKRVYEGSYRALSELYFGRAQAALTHIYDGVAGQYNVASVQKLAPGMPLQVIRLARRRQGLVVRKGNPKNLRSWEDLLAPGITLANRERGCGSRILLDMKLLQLGASGQSIEGYAREFPSALTMASVVARGGADAGIGAERVYHQVEGVDFLPLQDEWLDIVLLNDAESRRVSQAIAQLTRMKSFRAEVAAMAGYDTSHMGEIVYEQ